MSCTHGFLQQNPLNIILETHDLTNVSLQLLNTMRMFKKYRYFENLQPVENSSHHETPKMAYQSTSDEFYQACGGEDGIAGPAKIKLNSTASVAKQIWLEGTLWFHMKKALLAMVALLDQFECNNKSVFTKVYSDGDNGLMELIGCVKSFLPCEANSATADNNDCEDQLDMDERCFMRALIS